jgi:hypothetical protein
VLVRSLQHVSVTSLEATILDGLHLMLLNLFISLFVIG